MANSSNVHITYGDSPLNPLDALHYDIATATVIARGDLIKYSSGATGVQAVAANTDNTTFRGLSLDYSASGETYKVQVLHRGRCEVTVTSATYEIGDALTYSSGANGTDWALVGVTTGAKGMFWSLEYKASAATTLEVQWDSYLIGISIGSSGPWESFEA